MSSGLELTDLPPLLLGITGVQTWCDEVEGASTTYLSVDQKRDLLLEVVRVESRLASLRLRLLAGADDVALADGSRDAAAWLTHHTRDDAAAGRRSLRLAEALDQRWERVGAGLASGAVNHAQAGAIVGALDDLPSDEIDRSVLSQAEEHLVAAAAHHGPEELRRLGRRILEVVAPEFCEAIEGRALEREEQRAMTATSLTMTRLGDGTTRVLARVPDVVAGRLRTYLDAFTSPRHRSGTGDQLVPLVGEGDRIPAHRRAGQAFCALLERVDPTRLPLHGGSATTLVVTMELEGLLGRLAAGGVGEAATGDRLSGAEVRRLACSAQIVPAVLGSASEVLDLGRSRRLFSAPQRKALVVRDRHCRAEGCTIPAAWCEAHHRHPWSRGGRTDLADGVLLCSWHHHRAHDPRFDARFLAHGEVQFVLRT